MSSQGPGLKHHAIALFLYLGLSLLLTAPLVSAFGTHVPGDGIDDPALAWNLWWINFSLVDRQISPFPSAWMFYPLGINLAFYTLTILNGLLSVPLQTALGLVPASNLILLSSFVLSGYGAYLLALDRLACARLAAPPASRSDDPDRVPQRRLLAPIFAAAFIAGLLYAFSSSKMFYAALGQFNIASSQWIPFVVLYVLRSARPGARLREPLLAALFWLLQAYAELTFASFLAIFVALYAIFHLATRLYDRLRPHPPLPAPYSLLPTPHLLRNFAVMALVVALGLIPVLANMVPDMRAEGGFLVEGSGFADLFSADLAGYALPTQLHPLLGDLIRNAASDSSLQPDGRLWQVNKGQHLTLGYIGLALTVLGLAWGLRRRWREALFWAMAGLAFFWLTLGPTLRIAGTDTGIPGPFQLLQALPFFEGNRYPSRYSVMLLISVVPLVAAGVLGVMTALERLWPEKPRRAQAVVAGLLAIGILFENLSAPLPLSDMRVPGIYDAVAADSDEFAVLDLPLGWRNGFNVFGKQDVIIMFEQWWQTRHEKPILGGNTSRNPEHKFRYFLEAPLIGPLTVLANADSEHPHIRSQLEGALAALRNGDPSLGDNAMLLDAAAVAPTVLQFLNTPYLALHRDHVPPEFVAFVESFLPVQAIANDGPHRLYQVDLPAPPSAITIRPADDPLARGEGWSGPSTDTDGLYAHRTSTRLLLPPVQPGAYQASVRARATGPDQTLALAVNGHRLPSLSLPMEWTNLEFPVPHGLLGPRANEVLLHFGQTYPVSQALAPDRPLALLVESAGLEAGNYGHIWLNGKDVSPNGRGYNLALIDQVTGELVAAETFDTHLDPLASDALVAFLDQADENAILALAVKDTAGDQLSEEAAQRLGELGLTDLRGRLRWSQASLVLPADLAGGDQPLVLEDVDGLQSTYVGWGPGWREPRVAAEIEWLRLEPQPAALP